MEIDRERNEKLKTYCDASGRSYSSRVKYQTDLSRKNNKKEAVMIIDESDERMFRNLEEFYKKTKSEKIYVICLTATAYDGADDDL